MTTTTAPHVVTINNNHRIFLVTGDMSQSFVCNIEDLESVYNWFADKDNIKIQHKWNGRFVACSKKSIIDMLKSLGLNYSFLAPVKPQTYKFKFEGREKGAIGKFCTFTETVKKVHVNDAISALYDKYDHIRILSVNGKPYSPENL